MRRYALLLALLPACHSALADRSLATTEGPIQPESKVAPYTVDLIGENGQPLATYRHKGKYYVMGTVGDAYAVRISNPTGDRVEAVISVDGLDVVDGQTADFVNKRGYIVQPYGELTIPGFRVSMQDVATFRFSSVSKSYAGRLGKARNVGVVGVAIFAEKHTEPVYIPEPTPDPTKDYPYDDYGGGGDWNAPTNSPEGGGGGGGGGYTKGGAPPRRTGTTTGEGRSTPTEKPAEQKSADYRDREDECCDRRTVKKERPGLGTEYGERRNAPVTYVRFERANATKPTAMAELRYNDHAGLVALGIPLETPVNAAEIETRETADPFPNSPNKFSPPPPGWVE